MKNIRISRSCDTNAVIGFLALKNLEEQSYKNAIGFDDTTATGTAYANAVFNYSLNSIKEQSQEKALELFYDDASTSLNKQINYKIYFFTLKDRTITVNAPVNSIPKSVFNTPVLSFYDELDYIKSEMDLTISQISELFGVTRKSVYDWFDGVEPRGAIKSKMTVLLKAIEKKNKDEKKKIKTLWKVVFSGESFISVFHKDLINNEEIESKLKEIDSMVSMTKEKNNSNVIIGEANMVEFDRRIGL